MTYVFKPQIASNKIYSDAPEWKAQFPVFGVPEETSRKIIEIVDAWRFGARPSLLGETPKLLIAEKARKIWPDTFVATDALLVVSDPVRVVIERLDPGIHQFFPLTFQTKRGVIIDGPWFAVNVSAKQDSVVMEKSRIVRSKRFPETNNMFFEDAKDGDVTVDPARLSNLNLWREARFTMSLLGSDTLVKEFKKQGLKFLKRPSKATQLNES
ncbi:MAG: DUF1629 domain-containing protein [Litoreibacter sp.]